MNKYQWILFIIGWVTIATAGIAGLSAAPWVPTRKREMRSLLQNIYIKPNSSVHELGCGTGTILIALSKKYPNANYYGYEISIIPYLVAKIRSLTHKNVKIIYKNLFSKNLSDADYIICFLLTKAYSRLANKFADELKNDAIVIIEGWPFNNLQAKKIIKTEKSLPFYIYKGEDFKI
jgi:SAM-dependent methyltransferase